MDTPIRTLPDCLLSVLAVVILATSVDAFADRLDDAMDAATAELTGRKTWSTNIPPITHVRREGYALIVAIGAPERSEAGDRWRRWWENAGCFAPELRAILLANGGVIAHTGYDKSRMPSNETDRVYLGASKCAKLFPDWKSAPAGLPYDQLIKQGYRILPPPKPRLSAAAMSEMQARMASCDKVVARNAIDQVFKDPATLEEPLFLFRAASAELGLGNNEQAAFLYLAARLRTARQILFEKGDRPQLLAVMQMTVGPMIMPIIESDPHLAKRIVGRVVEWDATTQDPFRERPDAKSPPASERLDQLMEGLLRLPQQVAQRTERVAAAKKELEQVSAMVREATARQCSPDKIDAAFADAADRIAKEQVEHFVAQHPLVVARADGLPRFTSVAVGSLGENTRMTVSVQPAQGKSFYAEVDVKFSVTPDRKLGSVTHSLVCLTDLWIGQRNAAWKDVCNDDLRAIKP